MINKPYISIKKYIKQDDLNEYKVFQTNEIFIIKIMKKKYKKYKNNLQLNIDYLIKINELLIDYISNSYYNNKNIKIKSNSKKLKEIKKNYIISYELIENPRFLNGLKYWNENIDYDRSSSIYHISPILIENRKLFFNSENHGIFQGIHPNIFLKSNPIQSHLLLSFTVLSINDINKFTTAFSYFRYFFNFL
jgi:hypothetical protein